MSNFKTLCTVAAALAVASCTYADDIFWQSKAPAAAPAPAAAAKPQSAPQPAAPRPAAPAAAAAAPIETRKPFVVIRFERPDPDYGEALYDAVSGALKRQPGVGFDLVAVTRDAAAARRNLQSVMRSLAEMGLPAERLSLSAASAADDGTDEVWIYLR
jgi:hypothetical protein